MTATNSIETSNYKSKFIITIFCPYDDISLARIRTLQTAIVNRGYTKCKIVDDYSYPKKRNNENKDQYNLRKSIYWLEQTDMCIFVMFTQARNDGVAIEIKHTCDHLNNKLGTSLIAIESKGSRVSTSLIRGTITNQANLKRLSRCFFRSDEQLALFCKSSAKSFLRKRILFVVDREST
jgi:hypothetical protein